MTDRQRVVSFDRGLVLKSDYFEIWCQISSFEIWRYLHSFVPFVSTFSLCMSLSRPEGFHTFGGKVEFQFAFSCHSFRSRSWQHTIFLSSGSKRADSGSHNNPWKPTLSLGNNFPRNLSTRSENLSDANPESRRRLLCQGVLLPLLRLLCRRVVWNDVCQSRTLASNYATRLLLFSNLLKLTEVNSEQLLCMLYDARENFSVVDNIFLWIEFNRWKIAHDIT